MKNILIVSFAILLGIAGCTAYKPSPSSTECIGCERLRTFWKNLEEQNIQNLVFFGEDCNEPVDEATFKEFKGLILHLAGCCACSPHPLAKEWKECNRLECIWEHLEKENIQKIAFYQILGSEFVSPKDWHPWAEITEPKRIKEIMKLLRKAIKEEKDKFANEDAVVGAIKRMQIITDNHKFIVPISCYRKAIRGVGWTSYKLSKKLTEWGFANPK